MLHGAWVEQHTWFMDAKRLLIRQGDIDAALAQKMEVPGSVRVMITRYPTKPAAKKYSCRRGKAAEDCRERVHADQQPTAVDHP